jgi:hypothetical protein
MVVPAHASQTADRRRIHRTRDRRPVDEGRQDRGLTMTLSGTLKRQRPMLERVIVHAELRPRPSRGRDMPRQVEERRRPARAYPLELT